MFGLMALSRYARLSGWPERLLALVVITLVTAACGQGGSGGDGEPGDINIPDRAIGLVPAKWVGYGIIDVGRLMDEGQDAHIEDFEESWGDTLDWLGILTYEVAILATASGQRAERVLVLQGDIDFDAVRDELSDSGREEREYRGFELWEGDGLSPAPEVALIEDGGFVLVGSDVATGVLRGLSREVGLLEYEEESGVHELLDRVGDGWYRQVWIGENCLNTGIQRCESVAWSVTPAGRGRDAEVTWVIAFRDERSARLAMDDVDEIFDDIDAFDVDDLDHDGRLIVVSGLLENHDWLQDGLAWASVNLARSAVPAAPPPALPTPLRALPASPAPAPLAAPTSAPAMPAAPTATAAPVSAPPAPAAATSAAPRPPARQAAPSIDRDALTALYHSTGGENWVRRDNWLSDQHIDTWYGVTVNPDGRVSELVMPENELTGELPPEIGTLTELVSLSLHFNSLEGEIPSELADLTELTTLYLGGNRLSGEIPAWFGDLAGLENLNLSLNQLTGEIPPELGDLPRLKWLALSGNSLSDCIPAGLRGVERTDLHGVGLPYC